MALQLCAGLAVCKVMSDIATRTLEGANALWLSVDFLGSTTINCTLRSPVCCTACRLTPEAGVGAESEADLEAAVKPPGGHSARKRKNGAIPLRSRSRSRSSAARSPSPGPSARKKAH